ncbi:G-protein coupled receptor family C group 5 member D [Brachionichthys hirsutus]|uniref:G-protein coupled receptor family C group 5 member D n=1 Tax=Brachionichthys hirsutus TaxID=412623 RepID=UPI0036044B27
MGCLSKKHKPVFPFVALLLLLHVLLTCQSTDSSTIDATANATATSPPPSNVTSLKGVPGCSRGLNPVYRYLCDRRAVWGIVLETLASAGFLLSMALFLGLLLWSVCVCVSSRRHRSSVGGTVTSVSLFLLATAGIFAITFSFIINLTAQICPVRIFLFGVLFSLAFSCLLGRCLALLGFAAARGWGEPALALGLFAVQVIISTQWLILVLIRNKTPCEYSQEEFVMLQIYVLCLLAVGLILALHFACRSCLTFSYNTAATRQMGRIQATLLLLTLLLSTCIWVVWITMLTWGNPEIGRRPKWDDPVLSIALVANGWVLLIGHGLSQVAFLCRGEARSKDNPLNFLGWTSPDGDIPGLSSPKAGNENGSFESEAENRRGRRPESSLRSPYDSGFYMTEIDTNKAFSIPRPQTTNYREPYDEYYGNN